MRRHDARRHFSPGRQKATSVRDFDFDWKDCVALTTIDNNYYWVEEILTYSVALLGKNLYMIENVLYESTKVPNQRNSRICIGKK